MIYLAADHGGFNLKEEIKKGFDKAGVVYEDLGAFELNPEDDYPDFAIPASEKVSKDPKNSKAILICKSGTGEVIVANKFPNVRASLSWNVKHAKKAREHEDANVLALPAEYISTEEAKDIVGNWLNTDFTNAKRHKRRLEKIAQIKT